MSRKSLMLLCNQMDTNKLQLQLHGVYLANDPTFEIEPG